MRCHGGRQAADTNGPQGPRYLRWALVEAATPACTAPVYRDRDQQTEARIGEQRGAKVAQVDLARRLSEAIWHMLTGNQPFAPEGATDPWPPDGPFRCTTRPCTDEASFTSLPRSSGQTRRA
jgi:hypothetical protein